MDRFLKSHDECHDDDDNDDDDKDDDDDDEDDDDDDECHRQQLSCRRRSEVEIKRHRFK